MPKIIKQICTIIINIIIIVIVIVIVIIIIIICLFIFLNGNSPIDIPFSVSCHYPQPPVFVFPFRVVPERLAVSIPASGSRPPTNTDNAYRLDYLRMPDTTFLPVDRAPPKRHYVINPEWYSEKPNMNFVKPGHGPLSW